MIPPWRLWKPSDPFGRVLAVTLLVLSAFDFFSAWVPPHPVIPTTLDIIFGMLLLPMAWFNLHMGMVRRARKEARAWHKHINKSRKNRPWN